MASTKIIISTEDAPKPIAPYNQAVALDKTLYLSGVIGIDKDTMQLVKGGIQYEAKKALENMGALLKAADSCYNKVVKVTILLKDMNDFKNVNDIYKQFFKSNFPARTAYQVSKLPMDASIEIEAVACMGNVNTVSKL